MPVIDSNDGGPVPSSLGGPCTPYFDPSTIWDDPKLCLTEDPTEDQQAEIALAGERAAATLWALLGRQYPGACLATVRPVRAGAHCWDAFDHVGFGLRHYDSADTVIDLHNPTRGVHEVKIDGVPFTAFHVRSHHQLVRNDGFGWPTNQSVHLPDSSDGTFSVTYSYGAETPDDVVAAAKELALHYWVADHPGGRALDPGTTGISRQGQTISRQRDLDTARQAGPALPLVMSAIASHNPYGQRVPAYSWSPPAWELIVVSQSGPVSAPA